MLQSRFLYICMLIGLSFFYLFSSSYVAFFLFWFFVSITLLNVIYVLTLKNKVIITLNSQLFAQKQAEGALTIVFQNKHILPITSIHCMLKIKNKLTNEVHEEMIITSLNSLSTKQLPVFLRSEHSGVIDVSIKRVYCKDFFRVFKKTIDVDVQTSITFMPMFLQGMTEDTIATKEIAEVAMFSSEQKGNLNEEMIALKEYVPGDNVKHIHWKLSSKLDELIVKELADVREEHIVILFETSITIKEKSLRVQTIDRMMDTFSSIMKQFLEMEKPIEVVWYDDEVKELYMEELYGMNGMQQILQSVLSVSVAQHTTTTYEQFLQKERRDAVIFYVTTELDTQVSSAERNSQYIPVYAEQWAEYAEKDEPDYEGVI